MKYKHLCFVLLLLLGVNSLGFTNPPVPSGDLPITVHGNLQIVSHSLRELKIRDQYLSHYKVVFNETLESSEDHKKAKHHVSIYGLSPRYGQRHQIILEKVDGNQYQKIWIDPKATTSEKVQVNINYRAPYKPRKKGEKRQQRNLNWHQSISLLNDIEKEMIPADAPIAKLAEFQIEYGQRTETIFQLVRKRLYEKAGIEVPTPRGRGGRLRVDLMSIFSGALAIQESLQPEALQVLSEGERTIEGHSLKGPEIKSHPWKEMNAESHLECRFNKFSRYVPQDHFYVSAKSLSELISLENELSNWSSSILNASSRFVKEINLRRKYLNRLGLGENKLIKELAGYLIEEVAIVSPDFFFIEGTSIAAILDLKSPEIFEQFLKVRYKNHEAFNSGQHTYTKSESDHGEVYYLNQGDDYIISSSPVLMDAILTAYKSGKNMRSTGDFEYIRRLKPVSDDEMAFVYFSDSAIRKWLGPKYKILGSRRILSQTDLIHKTISKLVEGGKIGELVCEYGKPWNLKPIGELEFDKITRGEQNAYTSFLNNYNSYWSKFFDPIGLQIKKSDKGLSFETVILPLIENSIYTQLKTVFNDRDPVQAPGLHTGEVFNLTISGNIFSGMSGLLRAGREEMKEASGLCESTALRVFDGEPIIYSDLIKLQSRLMGGGTRGMMGMAGYVSFLTMPTCLEFMHNSRDRVLALKNQIRRKYLDSPYINFSTLQLSESYGDLEVFIFEIYGISLRFYVQVSDTHFRITNNLDVLRTINTESVPSREVASHATLSWRPSEMKRMLHLSQINQVGAEQQHCHEAQSMRDFLKSMGITISTFEDVMGYTPSCPNRHKIESGRCRVHGSSAEAETQSLSQTTSLDDIELYLSLNEEGLWSEVHLTPSP